MSASALLFTVVVEATLIVCEWARTRMIKREQVGVRK
jgi:hypothetical protein